ncbi:MAG: hypothetical protein ACFFCF_11745 [Promethearchaeota archaeon]
MNDSMTVGQAESQKGLSTEMWILLILFAALLLSNAGFLLALLVLGPDFVFLAFIGLASSRILFFVLIILLAIYYTRRKSKKPASNP